MTSQDGIDYDPRTLEAIGACVITLAEIILVPLAVFLTVMLGGWLLQLLGRSIIWAIATPDLQDELRKRSP